MVVLLVVITNVNPLGTLFLAGAAAGDPGLPDRALPGGQQGDIRLAVDAHSVGKPGKLKPVFAGRIHPLKGVILCGMDSLRILWTRANRAL